jgi:hypothetical protein
MEILLIAILKIMAEKQTCINYSFSKDYFYKKEVELGVPITRDVLTLDENTGIESITTNNTGQYQDITKYYTIQKEVKTKYYSNQALIPKADNPNWGEVKVIEDINFIEKFIPFQCNETLTNAKGLFSLPVNPKDLTPSPLPFLNPKIKIIADGYKRKKIPITKEDGSPIFELNEDIILIGVNEEKEKEQRKNKKSTYKEVKKQKTNKKTNEGSSVIIRKQYKNIKQVLLPALIDIAYQYGLQEFESAYNEWLDDITDDPICPKPSEIDRIIKTKNSLVNSLNNSFVAIDVATKVLGITGGVIEILSSAYTTLSILPLPTSTGIPGVPGLPISVINLIEDFKLNYKDTISDLRKLNESILSLISLIRTVLIQCIQILNFIDQAFALCSGPTSTTQSDITNLLTTLTESSPKPLPVLPINGFIFDVETEITDRDLKRRRALAKNSQDVVLLKGEWSFSSIDQILIDELIFYIQQNDLKAD